MTDDEINRRFPHQIVLPAQWYSGANFRLVHAFCIGLSLAPRGHAVSSGNEWRYVFCFASRDDAETIRQRFGGEWFEKPNVISIAESTQLKKSKGCAER